MMDSKRCPLRIKKFCSATVSTPSFANSFRANSIPLVGVSKTSLFNSTVVSVVSSSNSESSTSESQEAGSSLSSPFLSGVRDGSVVPMLPSTVPKTSSIERGTEAGSKLGASPRTVFFASLLCVSIALAGVCFSPESRDLLSLSLSLSLSSISNSGTPPRVRFINAK